MKIWLTIFSISSLFAINSLFGAPPTGFEDPQLLKQILSGQVVVQFVIKKIPPAVCHGASRCVSAEP